MTIDHWPWPENLPISYIFVSTSKYHSKKIFVLSQSNWNENITSLRSSKWTNIVMKSSQHPNLIGAHCWEGGGGPLVSTKRTILTPAENRWTPFGTIWSQLFRILMSFFKLQKPIATIFVSYIQIRTLSYSFWALAGKPALYSLFTVQSQKHGTVIG